MNSGWRGLLFGLTAIVLLTLTMGAAADHTWSKEAQWLLGAMSASETRGPAASGSTVLAVAAYNGFPDGGARDSMYFPFVARGIPGGGHNTTLYVQNTASDAVLITLTFYNADGSVAAKVNDIIAAHGLRIYDQQMMTAVPPGFLGSAVLSSDRPIATVVNWQSPKGDSLLSYEGIAAGATRGAVPTVMRNNGGWNTFFVVQNAGAAEAAVAVTYSGGVTQSATIRPGAAAIFDQSTFTELGDIYAGSAIVTSDQPVAVVATQWNSLVANAEAYVCTSYPEGALLMPRQQKEVDGWSCGTLLFNIGAELARVSHRFYERNGSLAGVSDYWLPAEGSIVYFPYSSLPDGFDGASEATSDQPLLSLVNCMNPSLVGDSHYFSISGVGGNHLDSQAHLPRVAHLVAEGVRTQFSVQNAGGADALVTITFYDISGDARVVLSDVIPTHGVSRYATEHVAGLGDHWEGAVTISSDQPIAAEALQFLYAPSQAPTPTSTPTPTQPTPLRRIHLPVIRRSVFRPHTPAPTNTPTPTATPLPCTEPANNTREGACGPLLPGVVYRGYISSASDEFDWFYFDMPAAHTIEAWLTDIPPGCDYDLYLTDAHGDLIQDSANGGNQDERIMSGPLPAGRYYVVVVLPTGENWNASVPYGLRVDY